MQRTRALRGGLLLAAAILVGAVATVYATRSSGAGARAQRVVMTARSKALHSTILVDRKGKTLFSLSVERHGTFICTSSSCLALWRPLTVAKGTRPTGVARLSTVKRPDGRTQVAYRGGPLYTFVQDRKPGDVKGNGFKDVGTWRVVVVGGSRASSAPAPRSPYGY